ncbi:BQ2448_5408 [Microbotryum intermedium]|uniref:BQ2448_5408 protein n=1 Tax=Microbotryum intermedium TaxID=269621 RepID=A0A238F439_9BASI|nr:BQ2448_5408 [Microbotryum intermedium]
MVATKRKTPTIGSPSSSTTASSRSSTPNTATRRVSRQAQETTSPSSTRPSSVSPPPQEKAPTAMDLDLDSDDDDEVLQELVPTRNDDAPYTPYQQPERGGSKSRNILGDKSALLQTDAVKKHLAQLIEKTEQYVESVSSNFKDFETRPNFFDETIEEKAYNGVPATSVKQRRKLAKSAGLTQLDQPKAITGGVLKDYQSLGVRWLAARWMGIKGALLADEMGTGKTLQTIAFLSFVRAIKLESIQQDPSETFNFHMVVAPKAVLRAWANECRRFAPHLPIVVYDGGKHAREAIRKDALGISPRRKLKPEETPVILTTCACMCSSIGLVPLRADVRNPRAFTVDHARRDANELSKLHYDVLVIDEAQRIKNSTTKTYQRLVGFQSEFRLLLTGTPLQNDLQELFALLSFILPEIFNDVEAWEAQFNFEGLTGEDGHALSKQDQIQVLVAKLHLILKPFMLRRIKKDVERHLPLKKEYVLKCPMTPRQHELYEAARTKALRALLIKEKTVDTKKKVQVEEGVSASARKRQKTRKNYEEEDFNEWYDKAMADQVDLTTASDDEDALIQSKNKQATSAINNKKLASVIMSLRQIACHPYLIGQPDANDDFYNELVSASGKMQMLNRILPELFAKQHKVLIFSQFTTMLDLLADYFDSKDWGYYRLDGANKPEQEQMDDFNTDTSEDSCKLFLLSTRAGGVGITLTGADTVILFDSDWNPQNDLQAMDRAHRIGQTKPVLVFRLETDASIDSLIIERATRKRKLEKVVLGEGTFRGSLDADAVVDDVLLKTTNKGKRTHKVSVMAESNNKAPSQATIMHDLAERLASTQGETIEFDKQGKVLSDEQVEKLLDRSDDAMQPRSGKGSPSKSKKQGRDRTRSGGVFTAVQTIVEDEEEGSPPALIDDLFAVGETQPVQEDEVLK